MEENQHQLRTTEKRATYSLDITSHDGLGITQGDLALLIPAETVIQEEESQWAEDNQHQQRNGTAHYIDDPHYDIRNMYDT